jgi:hypothetical protein
LRTEWSVGNLEKGFGATFVFVKGVSLGLRSLVFFGVLAIADVNLGPNQLMSFLSFVTVAGVAIGFGATDSMAVASDRQATFVSRRLLWLSVTSLLSAFLVLLGDYWINATVACVNYGLTFWSLGLVRRKNSVRFESISNFQMLLLWLVYFFALPVESSDFSVLTLLFVALNGVATCLAFAGTNSSTNFGHALGERSLRKVSLSKLIWEVNYSALTRAPFLMPSISSTLHPIFSYAYLLFETTSAMLSHFQTIFLKSGEKNFTRWIRLCVVFLLTNALLLVAVITAWPVLTRIVNQLPTTLQSHQAWPILALGSTDSYVLIMFMCAITALQCAAFGRYALKLESNLRFLSFVVGCSFVTYGSSAVLLDSTLRFFIPFAPMLLAGTFIFLAIVVSRR